MNKRSLSQSQLLLRFVGLTLLVIAALQYQINIATWQNMVLVPTMGAVGLQLALGNSLVTLIACCTLCGIHSDFDSSHWLEQVLYPIASLICGGAAVVLVAREFKHKIASTREERWRRRQE